MATRPNLERSISPAMFSEHYWLKSELAKFCGSVELSSNGSKAALTARILAFLNGSHGAELPTYRRTAKMPKSFARSTLVGEGWRCSQSLRSWIEQEIGRAVRFDSHLRDLIHKGVGLTLGQVIDDWELKRANSVKTEIAPQFEYNRFVREFRAAAPGVEHREVVKQWRRYRDIPASQRPAISSLAQGTLVHFRASLSRVGFP